MIIVGIFVQTVITTSLVTGVQMREDMDKGVFDRYKSLPISHLVTAVRDLVNAGTMGKDLVISLVGAAVIVAIFSPLTVRAYMRRT